MLVGIITAVYPRIGGVTTGWMIGLILVKAEGLLSASVRGWQEGAPVENVSAVAAVAAYSLA